MSVMSPPDALDRLVSGYLDPSPECTRILLVGDVLGRPGRRILKDVLMQLRGRCYPDLVVVNVENVAGGFGITTKIHDELLDAGVDVMTMGNHWRDKADVHGLRRTSPALVLPHNLPDVEGVARIPEFAVRRTSRVVRMVNLMGLFGMKESYLNPFLFLGEVRAQLASERESGRSIVLVDFHGEASSEKQAVLWHLDGISAAVVGTHTHTPTSDERVTPKGTAFLTDLGMTGPYCSVIGMNIERTLPRYFSPDAQKRPHEVADADPWFCGLLVEVDPESGLARRAHRLQYRGDSGVWIVSSVHGPGHLARNPF